MLGLRYALGLGRAHDLQDNKRSVRPRASVWYRPKALRCLNLGRCAFCLEFQCGTVDTNCGTATCPERNVALIAGSVGRVPKTTMVKFSSIHVSGFHRLLALGINSSPPSSLARVFGRGLEIIFGRRNAVSPFRNQAEGGAQSWPFRAFSFKS
ncbi:unnamed protein product [Prunus armeniaca]